MKIASMFLDSKGGGERMGKHYWEWKPVFDLQPRRSALLIIDMQNAFLEKGHPLEVPMAREQIPTFKKLIQYCRSKDIPIIYSAVYLDSKNHYKFYWNIAEQRGMNVKEPYCDMWDGKHETKIYPELKPLSTDKVIKKYGYDCFAGTDLDIYLRSLNISDLIITGTVLNWCVDSTVRAAYHKHYNVLVVSDAVSTYDHGGGTA